MVVYCDMCKVNHCGQKAVQLFPEDKVNWALWQNGILDKLLCETHKTMLERMNKKWKIANVEFVRVK